MVNMVTLIVLILIWKTIDLLVSVLSPYFIPYLGLFSYGSDMFVYGLPDFIRSLSNFDGIFYIRIALKGYSQYEQAYFPAYPLLIRYVNYLIGNPVISGLLISQVAFLLSLFTLKKFLKEILKYKGNRWVFIFLLAYPTSYYFGVIYTESLFLLFFIGSLYCLIKKNYVWAFIFGYLTGLTRVVGVFLLIPYIVIFLGRYFDSPRSIIKLLKTNITYLLAGLGPVLGFITYGFYLLKTTGDFLYFFHSQEYFGAQRAAKIILLPQVIYRYLKIFITADRNFQYFVALLELGFFVFAISILVIEIKKTIGRNRVEYIRLGLAFFSLVNMILPTLTGTLTSIPRYTLLSISIFLFLGEIKNTALKIGLAAIFVFFHVLMFAFFVQGYFVT